MSDVPGFLKTSRKKKKVVARRTKGSEPDYNDVDKLEGKAYGDFKSAAMEHYRLEYKSSDYKQYTIDYIEKVAYGDWKDHLSVIKKNPDSSFGCTLGGLCRMRTRGLADSNEEYNKYWENLPGTMGTPKPISEFINKNLHELKASGEKIVEQKEEEKKEEEKKSKHIPTIQERIAAAIPAMIDPFEKSIDEFLVGTRTDFKDIKALTFFRQLEVKQPHAKIIADLYEPQLVEMRELINPPVAKTDHEKDWAQQLKDGYSHYSKKQIKQLYEFYASIITACEGIIAERKANRKPRKLSKKAPEQVVAKLKYKVVDETYGASVEAHKFISANMLVIFNCKNRKLGVYYTSNEDPLQQKRDGTGLYLKGQTLQRYDEEKSVWKVLRKPQQQLEEVRNLNTKRKFENWWETVTTTPTKMNGRLNPETLLIGVY